MTASLVLPNNGLPRSNDYWSNLLTNRYNKLCEDTLEMCEQVRLLKQERPDTWREVWTAPSSKMPFGLRAAEMMIRVAESQALKEAAAMKLLPSGWGTLYELTKLPDPTLKAALDQGEITCEMTQRQVRSFVRGMKPSKPCAVTSPEQQAEATGRRFAEQLRSLTCARRNDILQKTLGDLAKPIGASPTAH